MKKLNQSFTAFVAIIAIIFSYNLTAKPMGHKGPHGAQKTGQHRMMTVKRVLMRLAPLNLSDEQIESVKQIVQTGKEQSKPLKQQLKQHHKQLRTLSRADSIDEQAIRETSQQIGRIKADLMILHLSKKQQIRALLTDQQRAQLETVKEQRKAMKKHL